MNSLAPLQPPTPLIDEKLARSVRTKAFATSVKLVDFLDSQVDKLVEIAQADLSLSEMIAEEGAINALEKQLAQIPAMLEMAKEAANPLTKLVGILRSEAPIPGEPKAFSATPSAIEPEGPPDIETTVEEDLAVVLKVYESPSEPRKKPKRRKSKAG